METRVRLHAELPTFRLPDRHGHEISLWDYKQQQPVVVVFCGEDGEALLRSFAARYAEYQEAGAEVLAIIPESAPVATQWPFPVLDSYNTLYERTDGPWPDGVNHRRLLSAIRETELRCPECGAPAWPET